MRPESRCRTGPTLLNCTMLAGYCCCAGGINRGGKHASDTRCFTQLCPARTTDWASRPTCWLPSLPSHRNSVPGYFAAARGKRLLELTWLGFHYWATCISRQLASIILGLLRHMIGSYAASSLQLRARVVFNEPPCSQLSRAYAWAKPQSLTSCVVLLWVFNIASQTCCRPAVYDLSIDWSLLHRIKVIRG